jgi:hypothetical protein
MLLTNQRMDKMHALRRIFAEKGMLEGTTLSYTADMLRGESPIPPATAVVDRGRGESGDHGADRGNHGAGRDDHGEGRDDHGAVQGPRVMAFVALAGRSGIVHSTLSVFISLMHVERGYPRYLLDLARYINQPKLPELVRHFLYD